MAKRSGLGIRVIRFKDFCHQQSGETPSVLWGVYNSGPTWTVASGSAPYNGLESYGNFYTGTATSQSGSTLWLLQSTCANATWASTDQGIKAFRSSNCYDIAMKIANVSTEASFVFMWTQTTGPLDTAYRITLRRTGLDLDKVSAADLTVESNWTNLTTLSYTFSYDTWYWIRVTYIPDEYVVGGRTFGVAGSFYITVDTKKNKMGLASVGKLEFEDSTSPITDGDYLGLGVLGGGVASFDGIVFTDGFIGQRGMNIFCRKTLIQKTCSKLGFVLEQMTEDTKPVQVNDRVELWIGTKDYDRSSLRVCDFDGVVKLMRLDSGEKKYYCIAFDETYELKTTHRNQDPRTTDASYYDYLEQTLFGERMADLRTPWSRLSILGCKETDLSIFTGPDENWDWAAPDIDMINYICAYTNCIGVWTPEGFFVMTKYIPTSYEFNTEDSTNPQPIAAYSVEGNMIYYSNKVVVSNNTSTPSETTSSTKTDAEGENTTRLMFKKAPATETDEIADHVYYQMSDNNPYITIDTVAFQGNLQPGCHVLVTIPSEDITDLDCMIVDKEYYAGDWKGLVTQPMGVIRFRLSYFDPDASPYRRPRIKIDEFEGIDVLLRTITQDRSAMY